MRSPARIAPQSCTQAYGPLPQHLENCTPLHGKLADVTCADAPLTTRGAGKLSESLMTLAATMAAMTTASDRTKPSATSQVRRMCVIAAVMVPLPGLCPTPVGSAADDEGSRLQLVYSARTVAE